ncbi:MAG: peptidylprolyl isomerase [Magnetococcales bacterium]|nr:peptidylprolyl isomerase [Magnetococcales bacterium]MBF0150739.1 peptidylprolyl isomerase [Magnetococcales bacterium]
MRKILVTSLFFGTLGLGCPVSLVAEPSEAPSKQAPAAQAPAAQAPAAQAPAAQAPFAVIDSVTISAEAFQQAVRSGMKQRFYHGAPPEGEVAKFQREIGETLVDRVLLVLEAKKRGLKPDQESIQKTIAEYDKRYGASESYKANRETMIKPLIGELEDRSLIDQLQAQVRMVNPPSLAAVKAFYDANPDKFTEPEDIEVSLILLKVDPSAGPEAWDTASQEANAIVAKLKEGADFAELARIHSADASAEKGGKMDYLHKGMLATEAEEALAKIKPGETTEAIMVLEGYAIFRLDKRSPPRKVSYEEAKERATALLQRETADKALSELKAKLRRSTPLHINEAYYMPLPKQ